MFKDASVLELGCGTGEHSLFYLKWGAQCTFVEMNDHSYRRAEMLFKKFGAKKGQFKIVNKSIFVYKSSQKHDIVISLGVIHHTSCKEKAFDIKAQHLKNGGFLVLGIGNKAGVFQRNAQRFMLQHLSEGKEERMVSLANELCSEYLDRAEKYGKRTRESIIYDIYINPKTDLPSTAEVLKWFARHKLQLYSSWPPIMPAVLADSAERDPLPYQSYEKIKNILGLAEIAFLIQRDDDIDQLKALDKGAAVIMEPSEGLTSLLNNITPETRLDYGAVQKQIKACKASVNNDFNLYAPYFYKLRKFLVEAEVIFKALETRELDLVKKSLNSSEFFFRGTCGLGMNYYIGHRAKKN